MSTRCDTALVVKPLDKSENEDVLHAFRKDLGGSLHLMNLGSLVPEPESSTETWRLENWGTPEEIDPDYIEADVIVKNEYYLRFFSANTPIVPWLKTVAVKYPELVFELDYFNAFDKFEGELTIKGGEVVFEYTGVLQ